jgi:hypothetical protein
MPQGMPQGQPQMPQGAAPMPQMAAGGLTELPVGDMFKFASGGGVVAFADGDVVVDEFSAANPESYSAQLELNKIRNEESERKQSQKELLERIKFLETAAPEVAERLKKERASELPKAAPVAPPPPAAAKPIDKAAQGVASLNQPAPAMPPPSARVPAGIKMPTPPSFTAPASDSYESKLAEFKKANPGLVGSEFQTLLDKIAQQDAEDRAKFVTQEKARTRADFWKSLIDAGEATRGQKGIGALLGGFGKSAGASQAAADERANAQTKMRRDQEMNMAKMRAELESARRAEARGDFESAFKHKQEADKLARDLKQAEFSNQMEIAKLSEQSRGNSIQAANASRLPQLIQVAEDIQRKNPQMSPNEAMERAASYLASGQYQSAAQRDKAATAKDLAGRTNFLDMQMAMMDPNSSEYKKMETQRQKIVERFMAEQKMLGGKLDGNAPAMPIKGTVERVG